MHQIKVTVKSAHKEQLLAQVAMSHVNGLLRVDVPGYKMISAELLGDGTGAEVFTLVSECSRRETEWTHDETTCPAKGRCTNDKETCDQFPSLVDRLNQAQRAFDMYQGGDGSGFEDFLIDVAMLGLVKKEFTAKDIKRTLSRCTEQLAAHIALTVYG